MKRDCTRKICDTKGCQGDCEVKPSVFLTADLQLHNHSSFGSLLPSGFTNRLLDGINALDQILGAASGGDTIVILGDVFETQRSVDTSVMFAFTEWVKRVAEKHVKLILVAGNHDHYSRSGSIHALLPFGLSSHVEVVSDFAKVRVGNNVLNLFAYTDDVDQIKERIAAVKVSGLTNTKEFLCLHQGVSGALLAHSVFDGVLSVEDLRKDDFEAVFLGHFHKPQELAPNVMYLGSPYQVTTDEAGDVKRFIKIDPSGNVSSIRTTGNEFHSVSFEDFESYQQIPNGYYRVYCSRPSQADLVQKIAARFGVTARAVFVKRAKPEAAQPAVLKKLDWSTAISGWLTAKGRPDLVKDAIKRFTQITS